MRKFLVLIVLFQFCLCSAQKSDINEIESIFSQTKKLKFMLIMIKINGTKMKRIHI